MILGTKTISIGSMDSYFHKEMISVKLIWGNVLLEGRPQIDTKNSNFVTFLEHLQYEISEYAFKDLVKETCCTY